ncbi:MAG TPA: MBL fold metallo-hydrolase [Desulfomonilia bacterium]
MMGNNRYSAERLKCLNGIPVAVLSIFAMLISSCSGLQDYMQDRLIEHRLANHNRSDALNDAGVIRIILAGTGSPQPNTKSNQPCTLVVIQGKVFVFDTGENAIKAIQGSGVPIRNVTNVFITHWHSDHYFGLGGVIYNSWNEGRDERLSVYGPEGVDEIVNGLADVYRLDVKYRAAHFVPHPELAPSLAIKVEIPEGADSTAVYDKDDVHIDAWRVDHQPVENAVGYLITFRGRKVFISGDTRIVPSYLPAMKDADLVVHEAVNSTIIRKAAAIMRSCGRDSEANQAERILEYHTDTLELAKTAQNLGVKHLALTHITPEADGFLARRNFVRGMKDFYRGNLTLGRDYMVIDIPAG